MAAGRLEIEIMARLDKLEAGLKKAETQTRKTGKTLDDEMATPMGKLTVKAGKLFAAMGAIEATTKLASTATAGFQGLFAAISGDGEKAQRSFEAMAETAKSLPFGIGPVVAAFEQMLFTVSGLNETLAEQEEKLKQIAELDRLIARHRANASAIKGLETRLAIAKATTEEERIQLQFLADKERSEELNTQRIRSAQGEGDRAKKKIISDSERQLELEIELAKVARDKAQQLIDERKEQERLSQLEMKRAEDQRRAEKEVARMVSERQKREQALEREAMRAEKEKARMVRERQKQEQGLQREAMEAAKTLNEQERIRKGQEESAARSTTTVGTAFGSFTFGRSVAATGAERTNSHLSDIDGGIKTLINLVQIATRSIGFA